MLFIGFALRLLFLVAGRGPGPIFAEWRWGVGFQPPAKPCPSEGSDFGSHVGHGGFALLFFIICLLEFLPQTYLNTKQTPPNLKTASPKAQKNPKAPTSQNLINFSGAVFLIQVFFNSGLRLFSRNMLAVTQMQISVH